MSDRDIRFECLKLAASCDAAKTFNDEEVIELAGRFAEFVFGYKLAADEPVWIEIQTTGDAVSGQA